MKDLIHAATLIAVTYLLRPQRVDIGVKRLIDDMAELPEYDDVEEYRRQTLLEELYRAEDEQDYEYCAVLRRKIEEMKQP